MTTNILETQRLSLRRFTPEDAPFICELVNDPDWIRFIGDKAVKTQDDARRYLENGPMKLYAEHGFGLWLVARKSDGESVGMCGLVKRAALEDVDIGFAILRRHRSSGYAFEAAQGVLQHARSALGFDRVVAIASPENEPSGRLLEKLGFVHESTLADWPAGPVKLYACIKASAGTQ